MMWATDSDARVARSGVDDALDDPGEEQTLVQGDDGERRNGSHGVDDTDNCDTSTDEPVLPAREGNSCQRSVTAGCGHSGTTCLLKIMLVLVLAFFIVIEGRTRMTTKMLSFRSPNTGDVNQRSTMATSNRPFPGIVPNLCFVHVGKTGGESIAAAMSSLLENGLIGGAVQIHASVHKNTEPTHLDLSGGMDYVWDAQVGKYSSSRKHDVFRSFEEENSGSVRHYRKYHTNTKARHECTKMGNVFTWIRDPVSRFVSVWSLFEEDHRTRGLQFSTPTSDDLHAGNLDDVVANLTTFGLPKAWEFFANLGGHWASDISFYFGEKHQNKGAKNIVWEERSKSCKAILNSMPLVFVGRTEHMTSDWEALLKLLPPGASEIGLPHTHKTPRVGKKLSKDSIDFIRSLYAPDYRCISEMVEMGLVDESYLHFILSDEREYTF